MKPIELVNWTPTYEVLIADKSNYTPLGLIVLYIPLLLMSIMTTILICILGAMFLTIALPFMGLIWCGEQLNERYAIDNKIEAGVCKLATGLKLLRRC